MRRRLRPSRDSEQQPVFRASVDRVAVATVVRTRTASRSPTSNQKISRLFDTASGAPIAEFRSEPTPVSLALLVDFSGSMDVAEKRDTAHEIAGRISAG